MKKLLVAAGAAALGAAAVGRSARGRRAVEAGQKFVIVDTLVPGGRWVDNIIYDSSSEADRAAAYYATQGDVRRGHVQVIDAVWYAPAEARLRTTGMRAARGRRDRDRGERRELTKKHRAKMIRTFAVRNGLTPRQVEDELKHMEWRFRLNPGSGELKGVHTESELRRALESMLAHGPSQREYRRKSKREPLRHRRREEKHRGRRVSDDSPHDAITYGPFKDMRAAMDFRREAARDKRHYVSAVYLENGWLVDVAHYFHGLHERKPSTRGRRAEHPDCYIVTLHHGEGISPSRWEEYGREGNIDAVESIDWAIRMGDAERGTVERVLPGGGMKKVYSRSAKKGSATRGRRADEYVGHHMRKGGKDYVDTAFMNKMRQVNPRWDLTHMGFGEFYLPDSGEGRVDFARTDQWGSGFKIPGGSGRTHHFYDNVGGKFTRKILRAMEKANASVRVSARGKASS